MTISAEPGPNVTWGQLQPVVPGTAPPDYNPDAGPSGDFAGRGLLDMRFGYKIGGSDANIGAPIAIIFPPGNNYAVIDQVPSVAATANIAALANATNGTPLALVTATGAGVTVMATSLFIFQTGLTVPACLALDGIPGIVAFSQNGNMGAADPTKSLARAVQITAAAGAAGGVVQVQGYDLYGRPQTENITAVAASSVNGKKAFKFVSAIVPQFTDAHNYSAGIADVYGLPLRADVYGYVSATFNNAPVTVPGFVAAVTTSPATSTTGDVRGTLTVASDGTKRLQIQQGVSPANCLTVAGNFGVTPA
jgi:hypothetical protein